MENFALNLGINRTSLGQVSISLLKEIYKRELSPCIFPIGPIDLTTHKKDEDFNNWLTNCIQKSYSNHNRNNIIFKNWHLSGGIESFSKDQCLFSYLETDRATETEINVIKNQKVVFVCNEYLKNLLNNQGADNVVYCPLGFDSESFYNIKKKCYNDNRITFLLAGKYEQRKGHSRVIKAWLKKYGNNRNYMLHLSINNGFLSPEQNNQILGQIFEGKQYSNVNILPLTNTNLEYNKVLNSCDIVIDMSHNENWSLPSFQCVGIGKYAVVHNVCGIKQWATPENSILVETNGEMIDAADGMFFNKGGPFSQGQYFNWNEDDFINGCDKAVERFITNPFNEAGTELSRKFTYSKSLDIILENLK